MIAASGVGRQEGNHVCHVVDFNHAAQAAEALNQGIVDPFGHFDARGNIGSHPARCHCIEADGLVHVFHRERLGHVVQARLGRAIRGCIGLADEGCGGGDVDHRAVRLQQVRDRGLDQIEGRAQVHGQRLLPIGRAHLVCVAHDDDTGHIAERIQSAERRCRGGNGRGAVIVVGQIR